MKLNFKKTGNIFRLALYILIIGTFSILCVLNASTYSIPENALSMTYGDLTGSGRMDIIVGHGKYHTTNWAGLSVLYNENNTIFVLDTTYMYIGSSLSLSDFDKNGIYDLVTQCTDGTNMQIGIWLNYFTDSCDFSAIYLTEYPDDIKTGDIDGDGNTDIVFYSNYPFFWGYMKNDGNGQFSAPIYYNEFENPLGSIACGDLNNDGVDEVIVSRSPDKLLIYSSGWLIDEITYSTDYSEIWVRDINKDGNNEIIVAGGIIGAYTELLIFSKNEAKGFSLTYSKRISEAMTRLSIADLNKDDYPDIVYNCSYYYPNSDYEKWHTYILYNENGVSFADPVNYQTYFGDTPNYTSTIRSFVADIDGNTLKDIVALNSSYSFENDVTILFQTEEGDFVQEPQTGIENHNLVSRIELYQNYPNPFNNETKIQFSLEAPSEVELSVYNGKGELVRNLVSSKLNKGKHNFSFKAEGINSGVYFYRLSVDGVAKETKKMLYLR